MERKIWGLMIPFTGQKHAHSDTSNVDDERKTRRIDTSKKYGCVYTSCHRKDLMQCDCVIFVKKNYNIGNTNVPEHKSISQHVDTGQLNVPPLQQPITLSLTRVMLN